MLPLFGRMIFTLRHKPLKTSQFHGLLLLKVDLLRRSESAHRALSPSHIVYQSVSVVRKIYVQYLATAVQFPHQCCNNHNQKNLCKISKILKMKSKVCVLH